MGEMKKAESIIIIISFIAMIIINIFVCFRVINLGLEHVKLYEENKSLNDVIDMKNSMISDLEESSAKLQEELEYVKAKVGWNISNYIEE